MSSLHCVGRLGVQQFYSFNQDRIPQSPAIPTGCARRPAGSILAVGRPR